MGSILRVVVCVLVVGRVWSVMCWLFSVLIYSVGVVGFVLWVFVFVIWDIKEKIVKKLIV